MRLELENLNYFGFKNLDAVYEGEVKNNLPHGKGKLIYSHDKKSKLEQMTFEGTFEEGEPITGKLCDMFGAIYEGEFTSYTADDGTVLDGRGKMISELGDVYTGGWSSGEKNGHGIMEYADGRMFEGLWIDNSVSEGKMIFPDGTEFTGLFTQLTEKFDYGEITYLNGFSFKGYFFFNYEEHESYVHYTCSGTIIDKDYTYEDVKIKLVDKNKANFSKLMWPMPSMDKKNKEVVTFEFDEHGGNHVIGDTYIGEVNENGEPHGRGVLKSKDNYITTNGWWKNGLLHGEATISEGYNKENKDETRKEKRTGNFVDGFMHGTHTFEAHRQGKFRKIIQEFENDIIVYDTNEDGTHAFELKELRHYDYLFSKNIDLKCQTTYQIIVTIQYFQ